MSRKINSKKIAINVILLLMMGFLLTPNIANAKVMPGCNVPVETSTYKPIKINMSLPNITTEVIEQSGHGQIRTYQVKNLQCFTIGIYTYLVGVIGILATVMIMYGGVKYLVSLGNPTRMAGAKDTIFSAVVGLVLVLGAYILLNLINPNLTELKVAGLKTVQATNFPACTAQAVPDKGADKNGCGGMGTEPNVSGDGESGVRCRYLKCTGNGEVCAKQNSGDGEKADYKCTNVAAGCRATADPDLCEQYSVPGVGSCEFFELLGVGGCFWLPVMNCPSNWSQTDCSECFPLTASNGCKPFTKHPNLCMVDAFTPLYFYDLRLDTPDQFEGAQICCKKPVLGEPNNPQLHCSHNHYNPGITDFN